MLHVCVSVQALSKEAATAIQPWVLYRAEPCCKSAAPGEPGSAGRRSAHPPSSEHCLGSSCSACVGWYTAMSSCRGLVDQWYCCMSDVVVALWLVLSFCDLRSYVSSLGNASGSQTGIWKFCQPWFVFIYSFSWQETEFSTESISCWSHAYSAKAVGSLSFSSPIPSAETSVLAPCRPCKLAELVLEMRQAATSSGAALEAVSVQACFFFFLSCFLQWGIGMCTFLSYFLLQKEELIGSQITCEWMSSALLPFPACSYRLGKPNCSGNRMCTEGKTHVCGRWI